jgi:hypothetical protein
LAVTTVVTDWGFVGEGILGCLQSCRYKNIIALCYNIDSGYVGFVGSKFMGDCYNFKEFMFIDDWV